jgi:ribosomal protein S18 acetylase RimI-like enzyme
MKGAALRFITPSSPEHYDALREIFREYAAALQVDLCFQDFEAELLGLPGEYAHPRGALLMALADEVLIGCCALRPLDNVDYPNACEMKRLYVRPAFRSAGVGRQLAEAILDIANLAAYNSILLDTLDEMESARALYQDLGFDEIPPYYHNPIAGAHYLRAKLNARR